MAGTGRPGVGRRLGGGGRRLAGRGAAEPLGAAASWRLEQALDAEDEDAAAALALEAGPAPSVVVGG